MGFGDFLESVAKITGEVAVGVAVGAGKLAFIAGKTALEGADKLYTAGKEDYDKLEEITRINNLCQEMLKNFNSEKEKFDRDFEREHSEYLNLMKKVKSQFETFSMIRHLEENNRFNTNHRVSIGKNLNNLSNEMDNDFVPSNVVEYEKGVVAGAATGVGAVGLMTAIGSAGTGVALSSLTGTAYIHATLAAMGGGTLAHGGLGMLGGVAVLGAAFLVPAVAVTAYFTDKQIQKAYEEAKAREKKSADFERESKLLLKNCKIGLNIFRRINMEIYAFSEFFDELLNMSFATSAIQKSENYFQILNNAFENLLSYTKLSLVDAEGKFNDKIVSELESTKAQSDKCRNDFYGYISNLSPTHQELINELKNQKLINDKLQTEIQWQKDNQPQNYIVRNQTIRNEFNKALREATEELDIISSWMTFRVVNVVMQNAFERLLQRGVVIKILYGIGDMSPDTSNERNRKTLGVAEHLQRIFCDYPNFRMKCTNTHEKLFICDEKFYVSSSLNILSFRADYTGNDVREESGEASNNVKLIREYRKSLFDF